GAPGRGGQERAAVCHLRARLDQDAERGRVYEAHVAEVDDEPFGRLAGRLEQRVAYDVRVVEVELSGQADHHTAVFPLDSGDGILTTHGRLVPLPGLLLGQRMFLPSFSTRAAGLSPARTKD